MLLHVNIILSEILTKTFSTKLVNLSHGKSLVHLLHTMLDFVQLYPGRDFFECGIMPFLSPKLNFSFAKKKSS